MSDAKDINEEVVLIEEPETLKRVEGNIDTTEIKESHLYKYTYEDYVLRDKKTPPEWPKELDAVFDGLDGEVLDRCKFAFTQVASRSLNNEQIDSDRASLYEVYVFPIIRVIILNLHDESKDELFTFEKFQKLCDNFKFDDFSDEFNIKTYTELDSWAESYETDFVCGVMEMFTNALIAGNLNIGTYKSIKAYKDYIKFLHTVNDN